MVDVDVRPARFHVGTEQGGKRLDRLVAAHAHVSRRRARLWISAGNVWVNQRVVRILTRPVASGAWIHIRSDSSLDPPAADIPSARVRVLYRDRWLMAIDKPAGLLSEPDRFGSPAVQSQLVPLLQAHREHTRMWLVHRLDAGTSGVMVLARTPRAAARLGEVFRKGQARKTYLALCQGVLDREVTLDKPLARAWGVRQKVHAAGKPALTYVGPMAVGHAGLATTLATTLVWARPLTGRTHQIRVHLSHVGHPILGDRLYKGPGYRSADRPAHRGEPIPRPMLHAAHLDIPHPKDGTPFTWYVPPPPDFIALAQAVGLAPQCWDRSETWEPLGQLELQEDIQARDRWAMR